MNVLPEDHVTQEPAKAEVQCLPSLCRGLYHRVAQKVGCDPSYVSRVARGERTSQIVSETLRAEIQLIFARAGEFPSAPKSEPGGGANGSGENGGAPKLPNRRGAKVVPA